LIQRFKASTPGLHPWAATAAGFAWISRYLLVLIGVSLLTMPITERLWTWDRFLQGGQDFELGALLVLSLLCLVLLLTEQCQQRIESAWSAGGRGALPLRDRVAAEVGRAGHVAVLHPAAGMYPDAGGSAFPLQI
jgi:hypothetical protein